MHAVVNRLSFAGPVDPDAFGSLDEVVEAMRAVDGFVACHVIQTGSDEVTLVIIADSSETLDRIATDIGSPWMRENIVPLLVGPPNRQVGPVLAGS